MIQVSLVGFATGGAFLSLLYFDVPFYLMAAMMATRLLVEKELKEKAEQSIPANSSISSSPLGKPGSLQPITLDSG